MFALIRQYSGLDVSSRDDLTRKANAELRPLLANSPGFVSYELIQPDDTKDAIASISVFRTRSEAEASHEVAQEWVRTNLPQMPKPSTTAGELVAH
jgi:heme-degrading monooxygenase HmoA